MSISDCRMVTLSRFEDARGSLTAVEASNDVPFKIERAYWLYDVPEGVARAAHAHRDLKQLMVALSGSCDVHLDDGLSKMTYRLDCSSRGLYVHPMIWRTIDNFSKHATLLILASAHYDESDYFREYSDFLQAARSKRADVR